MMHTVKVAVCSEIHKKHSTQSEDRVEVLNVKLGGTVRADNARLYKVKLDTENEICKQAV
jgi:hypothetical protein